MLEQFVPYYMNSNEFRYYIAPTACNRASEPVTLLPLPGEGDSVYSGNDNARSVTPNPEDGFPAEPWEIGLPPTPVITWPDPGQSSSPQVPSCSGNPGWNPGNGNWNPGNQGNTSGTARVRFLNAAYNYPSLRISVSNIRFVNRLDYAAVTDYGRVRSGYQTVTVTDLNGRIYLQRSLPFQKNIAFTVAIVNITGGLDLLQINDSCCQPTGGWASFRVGNLAYNSRPLDVLMSDGRVVYADLRYKEVAPFRRIRPGAYQFFYADTSQNAMPASLDIEPLDPAWLGVYPPYDTFGSFYLNVSAKERYSVYLLQRGSVRNNIESLVLVDG